MANSSEKLDFPKKKDSREGNNIHIAIYVPSTKNINEKISPNEFNQRINKTINFLRKTFNGSTNYSGTGNYKSEKLGSVTEKIVKVETFTKKIDYYKADLKVKKWLLNKKKEWGQESLSYEFEEELFFV